MDIVNYINLITISYKVTQQYSNTISFNDRIKYICQNIILDDKKIILDVSGEGKFGINLVKGVIQYLNLNSKNLKIIVGVDPEDRLVDYDVEVSYLGLCNAGNFYKLLQEKNINWVTMPVNFYFVALAHRPTVERALLIKDLLDFFKEKSLVSFGFDGIVNNHIKKILLPHKVPISIEHSYEIKTLTVNDLHRPPSEKIFQALFNLVLETNDLSSDEVFITEKSFKPFAWHQIPIFMAPRGHVQKIRNLGFDLFDDILDNHSYSNADPQNYRLHLLSLLRKLVDTTNLVELRSKVYDRILYNNQLLANYVEHRSCFI